MFSLLSEHIFSNDLSINVFKPFPANPNDFEPDRYIITNNTFASFSVNQEWDANNILILSKGVLIADTF